jgi:hypothetical protein
MKWLLELRTFLSIPEYYNYFLSNSECCSLLFRIMRGFKDSEDSTISSEVLAHPFDPLHTTLFQFFNSFEGNKEEMSKIRTCAIESGALEFLLVDLGQFVAVDHRKPDHFKNLLKSVERKSKSKSLDEKSSSGKNFWAKGTGYGTSMDDEAIANTWSHLDYIKEQDLKAKQISAILQGLIIFLNVNQKEEKLSKQLYIILESSCLVPGNLPSRIPPK